MRKVTLSALAIALAMGLSACSSSQEESYDPSSNNVSTFQPNKSSSENNSANQSSSENDSANQTNESNNQNQSTQPHLTIIERGPASKGHPSTAKDNAIPTTGKFNGIAYEFSSRYDSDKIANPKVHQLSTDNIYVLNVNGKRIDIAPEGVNPAYTYVDKDGEIHLSTGAFVNGVVFQDSMQNGIYQNQKDGKTYVYIQGELTPTDNIPKTGKVRYLGISSYHVNNDTLREGALDNLYGAPPRFGIVGVDMTANFEDKTVAGHLVHASAAKNDNVLAELEGTISGNQFSGTKNDTKLQGAFFGENANEMGGVYINEKEGFSGAFSARHEW
ncbi:MAG: transferrin-binding protein-like solute binding protein [Haemophilus parainfluenzae]|uniref:Transferrin-binding protein-like solute binding protein n=1 Tax=Haemophilus parainfluenzae TaxID=729 RepID=A0A7M1NZB0_HAEPA|nr:transferrin-binding protein-like solute binding protein [Haemophilus parainfluenzae]MBS6670021.1 transferrin-binding protein-like solute binding protein [Haemophilus parainfluenzae]QOR18257.1 transferrin-binding protein-like solute binding protein [Haemophilus parainfluenzae]